MTGQTQSNGAKREVLILNQPPRGNGEVME